MKRILKVGEKFEFEAVKKCANLLESDPKKCSKNACLFDKVGVDAVENEPHKVSMKLGVGPKQSCTRHPNSLSFSD